MRPRRSRPRPLSRRATGPVGVLTAGVLALAACAGEPGAEDAGTRLGTVDFPTSCSPDVQPELERGLALLHHMMYEQARDVFGDAAAREESCAMAHWGVAMSRFQPLWGSARVEEGRGPAERAVALEPPTDRERAYARAVHAFFRGEDLRLSERIRRWESAVEELHSSFPDDREAQSLYALAHLAVDPSDASRQDRADSLLREVHGAMPRHPGAIHYAIHVHDVEGRAEDGIEFARAYDDIAPSVPHALHMPSHLYVRLGMWDDVIEWNRRSADAALNHPAGEHTSHHYAHALDYLAYGHLQRGEHDRAREVLEELRSRTDYQPTFISAYHLASVPARLRVEARDWEGAAVLESRVPDTFPWDDFPAAEALTHFARGLGAARSGDRGRAEAARSRLEELERAAREADDEYWADRILIQRLSVEAWRSMAGDRTDEALRLMRKAADLASGMEKHPVTPGDLQPAHELLGDLLAEMGRHGEALEAYERSLETWPRRYHSLVGAARAAEAAGRDEAVRRYRGLLRDQAGQAVPTPAGLLASDSDPE